MSDSKRKLKDTSKAARDSNVTTFEKIKNMFSSKSNADEEKKRKRKELIDKERKRAYEELKPSKY